MPDPAPVTIACPHCGHGGPHVANGRLVVGYPTDVAELECGLCTDVFPNPFHAPAGGADNA